MPSASGGKTKLKKLANVCDDVGVTVFPVTSSVMLTFDGELNVIVSLNPSAIELLPGT